MGEYRKAKIIRYSRLYKNLTQEKLAEGICEPSTLAKYEAGIIDPSEFNYYLLMKRLDACTSLYRIPGDFYSSELMEIRDFIKLAIERRDNQLLIDNIKKYEKLMDSSVDNKQYVCRIKLYIDKINNRLYDDEYIKKLIETIEMSITDFNIANLQLGRMYSEVEMMLFNSLIIAFWKSGRIDDALILCVEVEKLFENDVILEDCKEIEKIYLNHSNILGQVRRYSESINMCKQGILFLKKSGRCNLLYNFYFNIGWNYINIANEKNKTDREKLIDLGLMYYWISYKMCQLFPEAIDSLEIIKNEYNTILDERFNNTKN